MPLPTPDKTEITRICRARRIGYDRENLLEPISDTVKAVLKDGFIDQDKAITLLDWLVSNHKIAALYPNAQLVKALRSAVEPGAWNQDSEHGLLRFISSFYMDSDLPHENISELLNDPPPLFGDLYAEIFDKPRAKLDLYERLCAFTGPCAFGSRKECYEAVTDAGGAPCNVLSYTDYLFVSEEHISTRTLSRSMIDGIRIRLIFGNLLICSDKYFDPKPAADAKSLSVHD